MISSSILGVIEKLPHLEANQNPYGYVWFTHYMEMRFTRHKPNGIENVGDITPVYAAPFQREWQGLTDEEILEEYRQSYGDDGNLTDIYFAHAIEAKLKEKNT